MPLGQDRAGRRRGAARARDRYAVVAAAPAELREGPRGTGRDRDAVHAHVVEAQHACARTVGVPPTPAERADTARARRALLAALEAGRGDRYGVWGAAWHVLDHVWEVEGKSF